MKIVEVMVLEVPPCPHTDEKCGTSREQRHLVFLPEIAATLNEDHEFRSRLPTNLGYFSQGLTLTIFEACHIYLSQGNWFIPYFDNFSAELHGSQTFCLCSGPAPTSSELKGPLRIRHFWDQSGDLKRILSEHKATLNKKEGIN